MSKKDVLHIPPPPPTPPEPGRDANSGKEKHTHHGPPAMHPGEGPGGTPSVGGNPHIIEPATSPSRYPGVNVS